MADPHPDLLVQGADTAGITTALENTADAVKMARKKLKAKLVA